MITVRYTKRLCLTLRALCIQRTVRGTKRKMHNAPNIFRLTKTKTISFNAFIFLTSKRNRSQFIQFFLLLVKIVYVSISLFSYLVGLYLCLFLTFEPLFRAFGHCVPSTPTGNRITESILIVWLRSKLLFIIIQCEAIPIIWCFLCFKHIANHTVWRYFTPHIQTHLYLTIIFIRRQSHFSPVKNMSCRAHRMPFDIVRMFGSPLWCCV